MVTDILPSLNSHFYCKKFKFNNGTSVYEIKTNTSTGIKRVNSRSVVREQNKYISSMQFINGS